MSVQELGLVSELEGAKLEIARLHKEIEKLEGESLRAREVKRQQEDQIESLELHHSDLLRLLEGGKEMSAQMRELLAVEKEMNAHL